MVFTFTDVERFITSLSSIANSDDLFESILDVTGRMGFTYFAVTEHVNLAPGGASGISLIHYPKDWEGLFRRKRLFGVDPVHRAAEIRAMPFLWSEVGKIIPMTAQDRLVLDLARDKGLGDGYTIPACIPGRTIGSCSFGMSGAEPLKPELLPFAAYIGEAAFERAKQLRYSEWGSYRRPPVLTDRQLDCVALLAQGFSTNEISKALNVKYETAVQHIKDAADRYGVNRRAAIAIRALLDGSLCFSDVVPRTLESRGCVKRL